MLSQRPRLPVLNILWRSMVGGIAIFTLGAIANRWFPSWLDESLLALVAGLLVFYYERRRNLHLLQRLESSLLDSLLRSAPIGLALLDRDLRYVRVNRFLAEINAVPPEQHLGRTVAEVIPRLAPVLEPMLRKVLDTGQDITEHLPRGIPTTEGRFRHWMVNYFPVHSGTGETIGVGAAVAEITELRAVQEELARSEARLRELFDTMAQGVVYHDSELHIISANPAACNIVGRSMEEMSLEDASDSRFGAIREDGSAFPPDQFPSRVAMRTGKEVRHVVMGIFNPREGRYRWIDVNAVPQFRPGEERAYQVFTTFDDITNFKRAEERLRANEKLVAAAQVAASLAHEVNNPLQSVTSTLYLLRGVPQLDEKLRGYIADAQEELKRIAHITRQTLSLYDSESATTRVSLPELLDEVIELHGDRVRAKKIEIRAEYNFEADIPQVPGDLRQLFSHVLRNSLEAVGEQGIVKIRAHNSRDWHEGREGFRVLICDNGKGIPPASQEKIFEAFVGTKPQRGTGLGLWVSEGIARRSGGSIRLRSTVAPGRSGTSVSVFLPADIFPEDMAAAS